MSNKVLKNLHGVLIYFALQETFKDPTYANMALCALVVVYEVSYIRLVLKENT